MTSSYRKYFKYVDLNNIKHRGLKPNPEYYYKWNISTIGYILRNRQYTGCIINKCEGKEYILKTTMKQLFLMMFLKKLSIKSLLYEKHK